MLAYTLFFRELGMDEGLEGVTDSRRYQITREALEKHRSAFGSGMAVPKTLSVLQFVVLEGEQMVEKAWNAASRYGASSLGIIFVPETADVAEQAISIWLPELRRPIHLIRD